MKKLLTIIMSIPLLLPSSRIKSESVVPPKVTVEISPQDFKNDYASQIEAQNKKKDAAFKAKKSAYIGLVTTLDAVTKSPEYQTAGNTLAQIVAQQLKAKLNTEQLNWIKEVLILNQESNKILASSNLLDTPGIEPTQEQKKQYNQLFEINKKILNITTMLRRAMRDVPSLRNETIMTLLQKTIYLFPEHLLTALQ